MGRASCPAQEREPGAQRRPLTSGPERGRALAHLTPRHGAFTARASQACRPRAAEAASHDRAQLGCGSWLRLPPNSTCDSALQGALLSLLPHLASFMTLSVSLLPLRVKILKWEHPPSKSDTSCEQWVEVTNYPRTQWLRTTNVYDLTPLGVRSFELLSWVVLAPASHEVVVKMSAELESFQSCNGAAGRYNSKMSRHEAVGRRPPCLTSQPLHSAA